MSQFLRKKVILNKLRGDNDMQRILALSLQGQFGNQRTLKKIRVWGAREEKLGRQVLVQQNVDTGAFNCKGFGHYAKEYRKPKRVKDYTYHKEKMMMCKQAEQGVLHSRASFQIPELSNVNAVWLTVENKPRSYFKELYENTNKAWKWWIEKKCPSEYKWTQTTPSRPSLKWKPTGRIFSNVRLRWIPTGKLLNSCMGKVDSEPTHGSIVDIPHIHACKQTLGLSAGTSFNGQKQQRIDLNADALYNEKQENL
ncbi:hypothetical protein Tco_0782269 [Tanacetum coccineum]